MARNDGIERRPKIDTIAWNGKRGKAETQRPKHWPQARLVDSRMQRQAQFLPGNCRYKPVVKTLLFVEDPWLRDQLRAGMSVVTDLEVQWGWGRAALQKLADAAAEGGKRFDWIWLQVPADNPVALLERLRAKERDTPLLLLGEEKNCKLLLTQKEVWKVDGFLTLPLVAEDFFRTLGRLRSRALTKPRS